MGWFREFFFGSEKPKEPVSELNDGASASEKGVAGLVGGEVHVNARRFGTPHAILKNLRRLHDLYTVSNEPGFDESRRASFESEISRRRLSLSIDGIEAPADAAGIMVLIAQAESETRSNG